MNLVFSKIRGQLKPFTMYSHVVVIRIFYQYLVLPCYAVEALAFMKNIFVAAA